MTDMWTTTTISGLGEQDVVYYFFKLRTACEKHGFSLEVANCEPGDPSGCARVFKLSRRSDYTTFNKLESVEAFLLGYEWGKRYIGDRSR